MTDTSCQQQRVLVVDDERDMLHLLKKVLARKCQCEVEVAGSGQAALKRMEEWVPAAALVDIKMPDMNGLELLGQILARDPSITVIVMTAYGTIELAVQAMKDGAYDFFEKPFDNERIVMAVHRALERTRLLRENQRLQQRLCEDHPTMGCFVGQSSRLRQTCDLLTRLASSDATVLIRGESGTGKELAARSIHAQSKRSSRRLFTVNCPALPEHILESELFGYRKGAFTGADSDKNGILLEADGSTVLLDEIADIPLSVQTKLLRFLQEKEIQPLGQTKTFHVDVRVLASTNQDLEKKMAVGEFREDLFYRLNVMTVIMPSLSEMTEDIPLLARHFLTRFQREHDRDGLDFAPEALASLMRRDWKGNVRELQNIVNRAALLSRGPQISSSELDPTAERPPTPQVQECVDAMVFDLPYREAKDHVVGDFTMSYIKHALAHSGGNVSSAARHCGIERQAFQRLMRRYTLSSGDFR
ncbi:MAG: DNA-binding response regulator [Desulfobulbaceae bacterium A2]|nr:MAG: DNA-binding response regulator [Desulfobulbaceae bacterium A2]